MSGILQPIWSKIVDAVTVTATGQSATFAWSVGDTYQFILDVGAGTGTSPTLDVVLQISPDNGTSWYNAPIRAVQVTTAASVQFFVFKGRLGDNEAAYNQAVAATGGTLAKNFIIPGARGLGRFNYTAGGTSPSFAVSIWRATEPCKGGQY